MAMVTEADGSRRKAYLSRSESRRNVSRRLCRIRVKSQPGQSDQAHDVLAKPKPNC